MAADDTAVRTRGPGVAVLIAAVVSGAAGYAVLVLAARVLSPAENADFLVFWGALFGVFGVLIGITSETTRAVFAARGTLASGAPVVPVAIGVGSGAAGLLGLTGPAWAPRLFGEAWPGLLPALLAGVVLFVVHAVLGGATAGRADWNAYAALVGVEATTRLLLCAVVALGGVSVVGIAWAVAAACGAWLVLSVLSGRYRRAWRVRADVDRGGLVRRMLAACTASGASALLLVGFPVLLRVTTPDDVFATAAPLILAVSLSRAPLLVPLGAYQNVVVTRVVSHGLAALTGAAEVVAAATAVGAVAAYLMGPAALRVVNPSYHVSGGMFAALMVAAGLVCLLTLTGAAALGLDRHRAYLGGWLAATAVAVLALMLPLDLEARMVGALLAGPAVGMVIHLATARRGAGRVAAAPRP